MKHCPECGNGLSDLWQTGRKLCYVCDNCGWQDSPRVPEQKPVLSFMTVSVNGWHHYRTFDRYGHTLGVSRAYIDAETAEAAAIVELERGRRDLVAGPYTVVVYPSSVRVEGKVLQ